MGAYPQASPVKFPLSPSIHYMDNGVKVLRVQDFPNSSIQHIPYVELPTRFKHHTTIPTLRRTSHDRFSPLKLSLLNPQLAIAVIACPGVFVVEVKWVRGPTFRSELLALRSKDGNSMVSTHR